MIARPIARRWRREWAKAAPHWRDDARRDFAICLAIASPVLAWLGLR